MTNRLRPMDTGPRDPRRWAFVIGLGALGLLAAVLPIAIDGGDEPTPVLSTSVQAQDAPDEDTPDTAPEPDPAPEGDVGVAVVTYDVFLARDPFEPVREPVVEVDTDEQAPIVTDPGDPTDPGSPGDPGTPGDPNGDTSAPGTPPDGRAPDGDGDTNGQRPLPDKGCTGDEEMVCDGRVVSLVEVGTERGQAFADVQVDTSVYRVRAGDTFAEQFRVLSIDGRCATLLYGDERFTQCEGEHTLK